MSILGSDPFDVLAYQQGLIAAPLEEGGAGGADDLDVAQRSITIGEVVPIVFGRRVGDVGGVLVSPGATEARFENDAVNAVTAKYHVVISEGDLDQVQVRDLFQRSCRVGTFTQSYNRRGGSWTAGNFIVNRAGYTRPECPYYCGSGGTYEGMTTGSFTITAPDGDTRWDRQVHLFIRGGMYVTRLLDNTLGPSNNVADLALWLFRNTSRTPEALIDVDAFEDAASFTDQLGLWFNGEIKESTNLEDWLATNARYFLLSKSKVGGKVGLRPLLPTTSTNALQVTPVQPVFVFDESKIIPGSFEISYVPLNERKPFCALMLWRQQPTDDIGLIRTTEVRYTGQATDGPFEQHDLSVFATSENHAVKVGAYIVARRRYVVHTLRIKVRPAAFNTTLAQGDIVQVIMQRVASSAAAGEHRYLYEVDRISKSRSGEVSLDLTHFPVDSLGRSLVALDVAAATGGGIVFSTTKSGISCDVNSSSDTTAATDDGQDLTGLPGDDAFDVIIPDTDFGSGADGDGSVGGDGYGDGGSGSAGEDGGGGEEPIDRQEYKPNPTTPSGTPAGPGVPLAPSESICGARGPKQIIWKRNGEPVLQFDYPDGGGTPTITRLGTGRAPAWIGAQGFIVAGDLDVGENYSSDVECWNGNRDTYVSNIGPAGPSGKVWKYALYSTSGRIPATGWLGNSYEIVPSLRWEATGALWYLRTGNPAPYVGAPVEAGLGTAGEGLYVGVEVELL
jgi:hypothetical protein